jgi:hypothetical protein
VRQSGEGAGQATGRRMVVASGLLAAMILGGCARQAVGTTTTLPGSAPAPAVSDAPPNTVGAASARGALDAFLTAVNKQDLQAMSGLWGNEKGLARDQLKRDELEKRLIIMQCLLQHDRMRFIEERPRLSTGGRQDFLVELTKGRDQAPTTITTVPSKGGRWVVENVDVTKLRDFCR